MRSRHFRILAAVLLLTPGTSLPGGEALPSAIDGVLYSTAGATRSVIAIDGATGETLWMWRMDEGERWARAPRKNSGRGVSYWTDGAGDQRIFTVTPGFHLVVRAGIQMTKQARAYVFDRVTGEPVWPIEERPVPQSDVPGEWTSPTQPFPTKPVAFDRQGFTLDDVIDLTPELRAAALGIVADFRFGSLFTPPSLAEAPDGTRGTLALPGNLGGAGPSRRRMR